jgi:nitroreductase
MMSRRTVGLGLLATAGLSAGPALADEPKVIELPPPWTSGGKPLAEALWARRSTRVFDTARPVPIPVLSNMLWSAYGINRPASGDRTVPSWGHAIEAEVYAAAADGVWLYDPRRHRLTQVIADDVRAQCGVQDFVATAPLTLVYVADGDRLQGAAGDERRFRAYTDVGFIGQNVYLFCASEGLVAVIRQSFDHARLTKTLGLPPSRIITLAQTVGYPKA